MVCAGPLGVTDGVVGLADTVESCDFAGPVADLAEQCEGLLVVLSGLREVALPPVDEAEFVQRIGFAGLVADLAEQCQGVLVVLKITHRNVRRAAEMVRKWVRQGEVDAGQRPGMTSEEYAEVKRLKREVAELRRANEILKAAAAFFGASMPG